MSEAELIDVIEKIRKSETHINNILDNPDASLQEIEYSRHLESQLPILKDRLTILITNPDVMRSSPDIIRLLQQIPIQEDITRAATAKFNSSGNGKNAIQYDKEKKKLLKLKYDLIQLIDAKKTMARGGELAKELRDIHVKQVEVNCAACEKARAALASLDASSGPAAAGAPAPAPAAAAPPKKKGFFGFGGKRKTRRSKTRRSKKTRRHVRRS